MASLSGSTRSGKGGGGGAFSFYTVECLCEMFRSTGWDCAF